MTSAEDEAQHADAGRTTSTRVPSSEPSSTPSMTGMARPGSM